MQIFLILLAYLHFFSYLRTSACVNNNSYLTQFERIIHTFPRSYICAMQPMCKDAHIFMKIGFALLCPLYIHHYEQVPTMTIKLPQIDDIYYFHKKNVRFSCTYAFFFVPLRRLTRCYASLKTTISRYITKTHILLIIAAR